MLPYVSKELKSFYFLLFVLAVLKVVVYAFTETLG